MIRLLATLGMVVALATTAMAQSFSRGPQYGFGSFGGESIPYVSEQQAQQMPTAYQQSTQLSMPEPSEGKRIVTMNLPPGYSDAQRRGILVVEVDGIQTRRRGDGSTTQSVSLQMNFRNTSKVAFDFDPLRNTTIKDNAGGILTPDMAWWNGWELLNQSINMEPGSQTEVDLFFDIPDNYPAQRLERFELNWKYFNSHLPYSGHVILSMSPQRQVFGSAVQTRQTVEGYDYLPDMHAGRPVIPSHPSGTSHLSYPGGRIGGGYSPGPYGSPGCCSALSIPDPVYTIGSSFNTLVMTAAIPFEAVVEAMGSANPGMGIAGYGGPGVSVAQCGGGSGNCGTVCGHYPGGGGPVSRTATRTAYAAKNVVRCGVGIAAAPLNLLVWSGLSPQQTVLGPTNYGPPPSAYRDDYRDRQYASGDHQSYEPDYYLDADPGPTYDDDYYYYDDSDDYYGHDDFYEDTPMDESSSEFPGGSVHRF